MRAPSPSLLPALLALCLLATACPTPTVPDDDDDDDSTPALDMDDDGFPSDVDCNDNDPLVYPNAAEACNGLDDDCDGIIPSNEQDGDGDGFAGCEGDCDTADSTVYPGAEEVCDGADTDCDGMLPAEEEDLDGDGLSPCEGDCEDTDAGIPAKSEDSCNGLDDDCDGVLAPEEADADGDGFSICDGDCNDGRTLAYPGAEELCNGIDEDCDGTPAAFEIDADGDGVLGCSGDCADEDPTRYPGAEELCNGIDDDCDGIADDELLVTWYEDEDADGWGDEGAVLEACESPDPLRWISVYGDCDDSDGSSYPDAPEVCDARDNDCDGLIPESETDADGDGVPICADDCDDTRSWVAPGFVERCNGIDDNCDGEIDEGHEDLDGDGAPDCETGELDGFTWFLNLSTATVEEPPGFGTLISIVFDLPLLLIGVVDDRGSELSFVAANATSELTQDLSIPTSTGTSGFADRVTFDFGPLGLPVGVPEGTAATALHQLEVSGYMMDGFEIIEEVRVAAQIDTREVREDLGDSPCDLLGALGFACTECIHTGTRECIDFVFTGMVAGLLPGVSLVETP